MLREEQIDIRRRRAAEESLCIQNLGRNRVFSDYQVTNPTTGGQYRVSIRGFDVGDNHCDCPDFRTNTLGTCKHVEAVLAALRDETPPQLRRRKAAVTHPEIYLQYTEQWRVGLHLPPRHSDQLHALAETFFDGQGVWKAGDHYQNLIEAVENVPEQVTILSDAMEFMEREIELKEMAGRERDWLNQLEREEPSAVLCDLLKVPLYPYQMRGAVFLACRGRCVLGDDMGLGKTVQTLAAAELLARERGVERVLVVAPASVKYQWETEIKKYTGRPVQIVEGNAAERRALYKRPTFYRLINYEMAVRDLEELNAWQPDLSSLDEAQRIKNWESKTSKAVKKLRSRYAVVLTGTPLENKLEELYSIVQFVDDRRLGPAFQFLHDHRVLDDEGKLLGYRNLDALREKLAPILLRRTRAEVLSQLPARTDTTVYVEMDEAQRPLYAENQATLARLLQKKYLTEVDRRRILCCIANLRMLCDSTFLLDGRTNVSPKLDELSELLGDLLGAGPHKVVVFSQWEHDAAQGGGGGGDARRRLHDAARQRAGQGPPRPPRQVPRRSGLPGVPEHRRRRHGAEPAGGRHGDQPGSAVEPGGVGPAHRPRSPHGPAPAGAGVQPGDARQHRGAACCGPWNKSGRYSRKSSRGRATKWRSAPWAAGRFWRRCASCWARRGLRSRRRPRRRGRRRRTRGRSWRGRGCNCWRRWRRCWRNRRNRARRRCRRRRCNGGRRRCRRYCRV